jgi:hypothetical protein
MLNQLFFIEIVIKATAGVILVLVPGYAASLFGLPATGTGFWPRLLGALLLGVAAGLMLQTTYPTLRAIHPVGLIAMNLASAAVLSALLLLQRASQPRRGTVLLWGIAGGLALLALVELSFV